MASTATTNAAATPGMLAYGGPAAAGFAAPKLVNAVGGEDATTNLGRNTGIGLFTQDKGTGDFVGSVGSGAAAGAAAGSFVPGIGTAIGAGIGAAAGGISQIIKGGTVICTELHRQGLLSDEVFENDAKYRDKITDKEYVGYRIMADPIVNLMQKSPLFTKVFAPFAVSTATEMASKINPEIKGNKLGKILLGILIPLCGFVYKMHCKSTIFPRISTPRESWRF
jgi:hypothetical protein